MKSMKLFFPIMSIILALIMTEPALADPYANTIGVFKKSEAVKPFFSNNYGYAVFPIIGKGGFFIGGSYGEGRVYKNEVITGNVILIKGSIGFQFGGQAFSQIIFFQDKRSYDEFTSGRFEFDGSASAVAVTAGAQAKAGTEGVTAGASAGPATGVQAETQYFKGMAVFIHAKGGLMIEASIGGQKFDFIPLVH